MILALIAFSCQSISWQDPDALATRPVSASDSIGAKGIRSFSTVHEGTQTRSSIEQHASSVSLDLDKERSAVVARTQESCGVMNSLSIPSRSMNDRRELDGDLCDGRCATKECNAPCRRDELFICEGCGRKHCGECAKVVTDDKLRMCTECRACCEPDTEKHEAHELCADCGNPLCRTHATRVLVPTTSEPNGPEEYALICSGCVKDRAKPRKPVSHEALILALTESVRQARRRA